ncbi:MAG: penicillin-binding protein 2, partial [Bacteroidales bacterium]|nr:penicillin-binding protein 2 [Bacteroidales bacterium]
MRKDYNLEKRKYVIAAAVVGIVAIYIIRLFSLQVGENDYKRNADSNAFQRKVLYPSRGFIYDRNGELLVYNQPAYDVMMIPREMRNLDTLDFCNT